MLTCLEISKKALIHNLKIFKKVVGKKIKIMAVVKSNAYGHGIIESAKIFEKLGANYLGVINLDEALLLRKKGLEKPIFILSYWPIPINYKSELITNQIKQAIYLNIEFPVYAEEQIKILSQISQKIRKKAKIHIKIDTGASRIGLLPENALNFVIKCLKSPFLEIKGLYTHFAKSEAKNQAFTIKQAQKLDKIREKLLKTKDFPENVLFHAGCTASTLNNHKTFFDMVRVGLGLYGLWPSKETKENNKRINLKPALSWKTKIIQVKDLTKGTFVGYDCTHQCQQKTKIAILPVGYWDGYDRKLSNCGQVLIQERRAPVIGRVCMNMTIINVSKIKNVKINDEVILLNKKISADELAEKIETINYEVITKINQQLPRIYK